MQQHIKVHIWGGAGEHGRSCYYVQAGEQSVLLDCGGKKESGGIYPTLISEQVNKLQTVFLSHAHEDHMAALPLLLKHGYMGEIWLTRETYRQLPVYARAWQSYVEAQGKELPYSANDWDKLRFRFLDEEAMEHSWLSITPEIRVCWGPSGHLPGSVWLLLELEQRLVFYSGDYSKESSLLRATLPPNDLLNNRPIELAIVDAAYGDAPEEQAYYLDQLMDKLSNVYTRGGHSLLPVPLIGRGLDLIVELQHKMPHIPIAAEADLISQWEHILQASYFEEWLLEEASAKLGDAIRNVRTVAGEQEREYLLNDKPHIILSPDGMMLAEPARSYGRMLQSNSTHAILFTGHRSEDAVSTVPFFCEVETYRYKVHQGLPDVIVMLKQLQPVQTLLVHTGLAATNSLTVMLQQLGYTILPVEFVHKSS